MICSKKCSFDAAHFLPNYEGKCRNMHGHHWKVEVAVEGEVDKETGIVVDFILLKRLLQEKVIDRFDHKLINDTIENPTAENIASYIKNEFEFITWLDNIRLAYIRVWETENSMVELKG